MGKNIWFEFRERSRESFKNAVGEELYKRYKSFFMFTTKCKLSYLQQTALEVKYWNCMNTDIKFVYRRYRISDNTTIQDINNEIYLRLVDVLFNIDNYPFEDEALISDKISDFVVNLESNSFE